MHFGQNVMSVKSFITFFAINITCITYTYEYITSVYIYIGLIFVVLEINSLQSTDQCRAWYGYIVTNEIPPKTCKTSNNLLQEILILWIMLTQDEWTQGSTNPSSTWLTNLRLLGFLIFCHWIKQSNHGNRGRNKKQFIGGPITY